MKELSIFVDESGDFGPYSVHSPYYLFSVILHEQNKDISKAIDSLNEKIDEHGFENHAIHTGPIVRNEGYYQRFDFEDRKRLFNDLLFFIKAIDIKYHVLCVDKRECKTSKIIVEKLSKQFALFVKDNLEWFSSFDKVIVYYDYGQSEITTILTSVLNSLLNSVEFRHVQPYQYKLFQVADMVCTLELVKLKYSTNNISQSERHFYGTNRQFKDFYYKTIVKKKI